MTPSQFASQIAMDRGPPTPAYQLLAASAYLSAAVSQKRNAAMDGTGSFGIVNPPAGFRGEGEIRRSLGVWIGGAAICDGLIVEGLAVKASK